MTDRCPSCGSPVSASGESLVTREDAQEALRWATRIIEPIDAPPRPVVRYIHALRSLLLDPQPKEDG